MLQWHQFEVRCLHPRPKHPILLQRRAIRAVQFILWAASLHERHTAQEDKHVGGCKYALVCHDACCNGGIGVFEDNLFLEELEPGGRNGAEDGYTIWIKSQQIRGPMKYCNY